MRAFEFQAGELVNPEGSPTVMIVNLDAIVRLRDEYGATGRTNYYIDFSDHYTLWVTPVAFNRVLQAWKSG